MMRDVVNVGLSVILLLIGPFCVVHAEELLVFTASGAEDVVKELGARFEGVSGVKTRIVVKRGRLSPGATGGAPFDVGVLNAGDLNELIKRGNILADSRIDVARSGLGLGVLAGGARPQISSLAALRKVLLECRAVAFVSEGAGTGQVLKLLERVGIARLMRPKLRPRSFEGARVVFLHDEADCLLGSRAIVAASVKSQWVSTLPAEAQPYVNYTAGISTISKDPAQAQRFMKFLKTAVAASIIEEHGMEIP